MFEKYTNKVNVNTDLNNAVINANLEKIKELFSLEKEEDRPNVDHEINGVPIILYAAQRGNWNIVEELYNKGADLDAKNQIFQWFLIHECIKSAPDRVTKAIFEYCNPNSQTRDGKTPLMVAITEGKIDLAKFIVESEKSDLSLVDKKNNNASHYAATYDEYDLFISLVDSKVNLNKKNDEDKTPVDLIKDVSFKENLPKVLTQLSKPEKIAIVSSEEKKEVIIENVVKPKVSGLSSIKRK